MCVCRVFPEALQRPKNGRSGCAPCVGGRKWLIGPTGSLGIGTNQKKGKEV